MNGLRNKISLLFFVSVFLVCCAPVVIKPTMEDIDIAKKKWNDVSFDQLNMGYSLYVAKCGSCHYLYKPTNSS